MLSALFAWMWKIELKQANKSREKWWSRATLSFIIIRDACDAQVNYWVIFIWRPSCCLDESDRTCASELIVPLLHLPLIIFHGLVRRLAISTHAHSFVSPLAETRCQGFRIMNGDNVSGTKSNDRHVDNEFFFFRHFIALLARTKKRRRRRTLVVPIATHELHSFYQTFMNQCWTLRVNSFSSHSLETRALFLCYNFFSLDSIKI